MLKRTGKSKLAFSVTGYSLDPSRSAKREGICEHLASLSRGRRFIKLQFHSDAETLFNYWGTNSMFGDVVSKSATGFSSFFLPQFYSISVNIN